MSASSSVVANGPAELEISSVPAKVGTRFSTRALRVLRNWFAAHEDHPYPRTGDMESLQTQTGLNKLQVSTWLANTRRRTKSRVPVRPTSPSVLSTPNLEAMAIPTSRPSELVDQMDPLGRWQNSPPEDEAADATAILKAISGYPDASAQPSHPVPVRAQPSVWGEWSSASSAGTSQSSNSSGGSAYSHGSASSRAQSRDLARYTKHARRRNRRATQSATTRAKLSQLPRKFQCTFCTESFAQKHGWQRHEKTMHLSLERWECSPEGPYTRDDDGHQACVYCSQPEPDEGHMQTHSFEVCMDRLPEERSFYRKDHLIQHLKAVHHVKFDPTLMEHWKQTIQNIKSSCGFCGLLMTSWTERADHLADHFKSGATMAQWLGDWGFDDDVVQMVQNSIPPYLIEFERTSPWPFTTDRGPPATPANAFELIKIELDYFASCLDEKNLPPSQEVLQYESCCVIVGSEMLSPSQNTLNTPRSWLRDLLMSDEHVARRARNTPLASIVKNRATELRINSKADIFDSCSLEEKLQLFMAQNRGYESPVDDADLQRGACQVVRDADAQSRQPSELFVSFLTGLINNSPHWMAPFRQRSEANALRASRGIHLGELGFHAPHHRELQDQIDQSRNATLGTLTEPVFGLDEPIDQELSGQELPAELPGPQRFTFLSTDTYYWGLRRELSRFVAMSISPRNPGCHIPTDEELQNQARWIMFDSDDTWNQTPADNAEWLLHFKRNNGLASGDEASNG
ncbi:Homeobox protein 4 like [Verticillium longisporum]|nr:Homeobox protein 4 like [Verticillium longisporum]